MILYTEPALSQSHTPCCLEIDMTTTTDFHTVLTQFITKLHEPEFFAGFCEFNHGR